MEATFNLRKRLIEIGKRDIVNNNIDLYLAAGRLTEDEYNELIAMLSPSEAEGSQD